MGPRIPCNQNETNVKRKCADHRTTAVAYEGRFLSLSEDFKPFLLDYQVTTVHCYSPGILKIIKI